MTDAAIECRGAPRDMGADQGAACRVLLRARFQQLPRWERLALRLEVGPGRGALREHARDVLRYFPHQAETLDGMASAADVPPAWLSRLAARELGGRSAESDACGQAVAISGSSGPGIVAGPVHGDLGGDLVVRRSRPEGGFSSVEVTRPWLTASLAGVNEAGLAVALLVGEGVGAGATGPCAAPAALLTQDCLQRFGALDGALDWCLGRPGGCRASLLLADATGEVACVEIEAGGRRVRRPADGLLAACRPEQAEGELAKAAHAASAPELASLAGAFAAASGEPGRWVALDPERHRLGLVEEAGVVRWLEVSSRAAVVR